MQHLVAFLIFVLAPLGAYYALKDIAKLLNEYKQWRIENE